MSDEPKTLQTDPRYRQANKEGVIALVLFLLNIIWWYTFAYGLGTAPPENYRYILGFPAWFFWAVIVNYLLFSFLVWGAVRFFFKDLSLESSPREETMADKLGRKEAENR